MKEIKTFAELRDFLKDYEELREIAHYLHMFHMFSNYFGLTKKQKKKAEKLEQRAREIAKKWGFIADICADSEEVPICLIEDEDQPRYSGIIIPF